MPPNQLQELAALAEGLEAWLGDPSLAANSVSFSRGLQYDERDELSEPGIRHARDYGLNSHFVPARLGGELRRADELMMLTRVMARRDMNIAVAESTQLWMMLSWIGGDASQQARHARAVLGGGVVPCLAYSEQLHGADLAAGDFSATRDPDGTGYVLSGEKWPINRGSTSTHAVLIARTGTADDPPNRRHSLFIVDRSVIESGTIRGLDRVSTYGLRGCDISGIGFDGVRVAAAARIGDEGDGMELALRGLLVTRTFCVGLSLGVGDTMLRSVAGFLSSRELYGGPAIEIPYVRDLLAGAYLSMIIAECVSLVAMRGMHLYPDELSLWANSAKVQVARQIDHNGVVLAKLLGSRYFMRASEHVGIFQKMLRDGAVVSLFDGSEPVCLDSVAQQLVALHRARSRARDDDWGLLYDLRAVLPDLEPARVAVFGRGRDAVFASLPALVRRLGAADPDAGCDASRLALLREAAALLQQDVDALFEHVDSARRAPRRAGATTTKATPAALMRLAAVACELHARVATLGFWLFNRDHLRDVLASGAWVCEALRRPVLHQYGAGDLDSDAAAGLFAELQRQMSSGEYFSALAVRQATAQSAEGVARGRDERESLAREDDDLPHLLAEGR